MGKAGIGEDLGLAARRRLGELPAWRLLAQLADGRSLPSARLLQKSLQVPRPLQVLQTVSALQQ